MTVIGSAPLTTVRLVSGSRVNVSKGSVIPKDADPDDVDRLLEEGYLTEIELLHEEDDEEPQVDADPPADADPGEVHFELVDGTIEEIHADLEKHGDDPDFAGLAEAYLEAETAQGGKNRATLIKDLEDLLKAHESSQA